tara:strand:- start:2054 stop:2380 length:327 start_codon:yes stop_codon:yes gene_type:complete
MEYRLRFIEGEYEYEVDENFIEILREMPEDLAMDIASQIEFNSDILPATGFSTKVFAGVTKDLDQPVFFCVEYAKEEGENTIYIDIGEVDSDTYLDLYLIKQTLQWQT